jgi:large subunit ribosomal protein L9
MKVILTQDVQQLGQAGTLHDVKPGFARNYLIPKGLAQAATAGTIKQVQERQSAEERRLVKLEAEQQDLKSRIDGLRLEFVARAGVQGRLYGSITSADVAERLTQQVGEEIDRRRVELPQGGIHELGEFQVTVRLVGRLAPKVTVAVRGEGDDQDEGAAGSGDAHRGEGGEVGAESGDQTEPISGATTQANQEGPAAEVADEMGQSTPDRGA